jgi:hypothetical protein
MVSLYIILQVLGLSTLLSSRSLTRDNNLLEGILQLVVLSHKVLSPLLRHDMLDNHLLGHLFHVLSNESRVPEFRSNAQILAAAHKSIRLAAFGCGGNAIGVKVLLLSTCYRDESSRMLAQQPLESRARKTHCPAATRAYSLVTSFPVTMVSPRGTRPQPPGPNALFRILLYLISGR